MTELLEEAPKKRPKISSDDEEIIELDVSDEGNLEEDVELENKLRHAQADLDEVTARKASSRPYMTSRRRVRRTSIICPSEVTMLWLCRYMMKCCKG